jgi:hypothetical protein
MLKVVITDIDQKFPKETKELSKILIEKDARESILAYLIENSFMGSNGYQILWLEYLDIIFKAKNAQNNYFENVVYNFIPQEYKDTSVFWFLDYLKGELTIHD